MVRSRTLRHALQFVLATVSVAVACSGLYAQQPPPPTTLEEVVVTGTRLPALNEVSVSPITSASSVDILRTGLTRVDDVLDTLPMVFPSMNSTVNNGADGTASVNLRGLGTQRTLVLVDGVRLGPGSADGRNWSDINQIPVALIERVDVLTGGASAVYGADAVAGVVNFIMNSHFEGLRVDAGYHFNQHSNDDQAGVAALVTAAGEALPPSEVHTAFGKNAAIVMGTNFANNAGNATVYVTYDNQAATLQSKFDYSACALGVPTTMLACMGSVSSRSGLFYAGGQSGTLIFDTVDQKTGVFRPFLIPSDTYNYNPVNYYQVPNERWTTGAFVNYDLNPHATVYTSVMYMRNSMTAQLAPSASFGQFSFIACADPLLTAQEVATLCAPGNVAANGGYYEVYDGKNYPGLNMQIFRRNVEGGDRLFTYINDALRAVLGVKGGFANAWTYNIYAQHARVYIDDNANDLGVAQLQQALNVLTGPNGAVCGGATGTPGYPPVSPGTIFVANPKCVPWNVWVPNAVTPAAVGFISIPLSTGGSVTEQLVSGSVTGDLGKYGAKVPRAEQGLQFNLGAEWRKEQTSYLPDEQQQEGNAAGVGVPVPAISGEFTVRELFTEMRLALASHRLLADDLSVEGGYRYSSYSGGFDTNTYKLGLQWAPVEDFRLRGGYQRAVRAPNISELFMPPSVVSDGTIDPCAGTPTASLAACELTGVKASQYGHIVANPFSSYNGLTGGNPSVQPEVADTYTVGLVIQPRMVPDLTLSVDYFNIEIAGVIGMTGANTVMLDCLASVGNPAQAARFCPMIHRDAQGSLWLSPQGYISDLQVNEGGLATRGIDTNASYRVPLGSAGSLSLALVGTYLRSLETTPVAGLGSYDCAGYFGSSCGAVTPKWRHVLNANWSTPWLKLDLNLRWRYIGPDESAQTSTNPLMSGLGTPYLPLAHIPAYSYFDLSGTIQFNKNFMLQLGVNNLADKAPPLVVGGDCANALCNGNTYPGVYDAMGRYLFAKITAQFL